MTRHFSVRKMLRMTPNRLLEEFFRRLGHQPLCIDWRKMPERCDQALMIAFDLLPQDATHEIESALSAIHELACTAGVQNILDAARVTNRANLLKLVPESGPYQIAMWTWLHFPSVFEQALLMQSVDTLSRWRKRNDVPKVEPRRSDRRRSSELACSHLPVPTV
jgi:hypothetical protein